MPTPKRRLPPAIQLATVTPRDMKWLWYPYIPVGAASMIFGKGGIGKSHIACAVAAAVSKGEPLPGQRVPFPPQNVLIMSAEDDLEVVLYPRLNDMDANLENIYVPPKTFILDPQGIRDVEEYIRQVSATICFIDPISSYMGGQVDMHRMNEVQALTGALHNMAQRTETAVIIVHHSKKKGDADADYDELAAGSAAFVNAVRSTMYVRKTNDGTRLMQHVKSNYAPEGQAISFELGPDGFQWGDFFDPDGLVGAGRGRGASARNAAVAFLKDILAAGPVSAKDIEARAKDEGITYRTLVRAKEGIVESLPRRGDSGTLQWFWRLRGDTRGVPDGLDM